MPKYRFASKSSMSIFLAWYFACKSSAGVAQWCGTYGTDLRGLQVTWRVTCVTNQATAILDNASIQKGTAMTARRQNVRLEEAITRYEERIKNLGQAEKTIYTAHYALRRFRIAMAERLGANPWLHNIQAADCDEYCYGANGIRQGVGSYHFNRQRSVLKLLFDYAVMQRWVDTNPMDAIDPARADARRSRLLLNASELLTLQERAGNPVERIALSLGMNTGLRANDLRHLTVFDASLAGGTLQTEIRKTNKLDTKPITMELGVELRRWFITYAEVMGLNGPEELPNEWLLMPSYRLPAPNERAQHIHPRPEQMLSHPWRMVQRPLARMGYPTKGEGFHTLRRSSARALFESLRESGEGRDHALMIVKDFLNHASVTQTELYLGLNQERVIRDSLLKDKPFLSSLAQVEQTRLLPSLQIRGIQRGA